MAPQLVGAGAKVLTMVGFTLDGTGEVLGVYGKNPLLKMFHNKPEYRGEGGEYLAYIKMFLMWLIWKCKNCIQFKCLRVL